MSESRPLIVFDPKGTASRLAYDVSLPGTHVGRRILALDIEYLEKEHWTDVAKQKMDAASKLNLTPVTGSPTGQMAYDREAASQYWFDLAKGAGVPAEKLRRLSQLLHCRDPLQGPPLSLLPSGAASTLRPTMTPDPNKDTVPVAADLVDLVLLHNKYLQQLALGKLERLNVHWGGGVTSAPTEMAADPEPRLFLVEVWGISSFLGNYGVGRTVKTMTLLPGETMTIRVRTWRATSSSRTQGSSIVDSHTTEAAEKFGEEMQRQTTDKATRSKSESWHAEAEASASWGFGSAKVSGGGAGDYHSGTEAFAQKARDTTEEHARKASESRQNTVTSSSEESEKSEDETVTERTIANVNMRRTLSFVFRELNQEYITKVHLQDVRVGFTNGQPGTWREVSLSGLKGLLDEVLRQKVLIGPQVSLQNRVAKDILATIAVRFDHRDLRVPMLEEIERDAEGAYTPKVVQSVKDINPLEASRYYRMRRGALNQEGADWPVPGVVTQEMKIVMRTDSIIAEALLGQSDALDDFAMAAQSAAADERRALAKKIKVENAVKEKGIALLDTSKFNKEMCEQYAKMFAPPKVEGA